MLRKKCISVFTSFFFEFFMLRSCFALLILLLFLTGCNPKAPRVFETGEIPVFNNIVFSLTPHDTIGSITPEIQAGYALLLNSNRIQVPLFRYIKSSDYELFLGIPVNTSVKEFYALKATDSTARIQSDSLTYLFVTHADKEKMYCEYIADFDGNLVYLLGVRKSDTTMGIPGTMVDTLLNYQALSKRFTLKKAE